MNWLLRILYRPRAVLLVCVVFSTVSLLFNGSLLRLYGLTHERARLIDDLELNSKHIQELSKQLRMARDPSFIEREARDRYDLADQDDLVFVFADE